MWKKTTFKSSTNSGSWVEGKLPSWIPLPWNNFFISVTQRPLLPPCRVLMDGDTVPWAQHSWAVCLLPCSLPAACATPKPPQNHPKPAPCFLFSSLLHLPLPQKKTTNSLEGSMLCRHQELENCMWKCNTVSASRSVSFKSWYWVFSAMPILAWIVWQLLFVNRSSIGGTALFEIKVISFFFPPEKIDSICNGMMLFLSLLI